MPMLHRRKQRVPVPPYRLLLVACLIGGAASHTGCATQERYLVTQAELDSSLDGTARTAIPATREKDRQPVYVKVSALQRQTLVPHGDGTIQIVARAKNPMLTAGSVLTWIGTAISLTGTVLVAVGRVQDNTSLFYLGGISALSAEPLMWTGTGLWIAGAMRRPYETPAPSSVGPSSPGKPSLTTM